MKVLLKVNIEEMKARMDVFEEKQDKKACLGKTRGQYIDKVKKKWTAWIWRPIKKNQRP
jgi:hypothetical protein